MSDELRRYLAEQGVEPPEGWDHSVSTSEINDERLHGYRLGPAPDWTRYSDKQFAVPTRTQGEMRNLGPRPADAMAPVSEALWEANPIMQGKGLADLLHDTYGKGREGDWAGATSNLPWLLAGTVIPFPGKRVPITSTAPARDILASKPPVPQKPRRTYDDAALEQQFHGFSDQQTWNRRDEIGRELNGMRRGSLPFDQERHRGLVAQLDHLMASRVDPHNYRVYEMGFAGEPKENYRWWIDKRREGLDPNGRPSWGLLRGTYKNKDDGFRTRDEAEAFVRSLLSKDR